MFISHVNITVTTFLLDTSFSNMEIFNNRSVKVVSRRSTGLENLQIPTYLQNLQVIQFYVDLLQDNRTVYAQHRVTKSYSLYFVKYKTN